MNPVGVGWVAEPVPIVSVRPGSAIEDGSGGLAYVLAIGTAVAETGDEGIVGATYWWAQVSRLERDAPIGHESVATTYLWFAQPDETLPVLVRRDVLAGEVIAEPPGG